MSPYSLKKIMFPKLTIIVFLFTIVIPQLSNAIPSSFLGGPNISYGFASDSTTIFNVLANPAMPAFSTRSEEVKTLGLGNNLMTFYGLFEFGAVDNLEDKFNTLADNLDPDTVTNGQDAAIKLIDDSNDILADIGDNGYFQGGFVFHVPGFPMALESFGGVLAFDINISDIGYSRLLDAPVELNRLTNDPESASSLYIKNAKITEFSINYSRFITNVYGGDIYAGVRTKVMMGDFGKTILKFDELGDDVGDEIIDSLSGDNSEQTTQFSIDLGVVFDFDSVKFGASLLNINEPEFRYQSLGIDCTSKSGAEKTSCDAAVLFSDRLSLNETHILNPQLKLDASWQPVDWWKIGVSYDVNSTNDPVGNPVQSLFIATSIISRSAYFPGIRIGYNQNLVGTEIKLISLGSTFFEFLNFDLAFSDQTVEIDNTNIPNSFMLHIGTEISF